VKGVLGLHIAEQESEMICIGGELKGCDASLHLSDKEGWSGLEVERVSGLACLKGAKIGATRTYACGEGEKPSLKQKSPCGSSGWGAVPCQKLLP